MPWHILPSILEEGNSWPRPLFPACPPSPGWACCLCHSHPSSPLLTQTTSAGEKPPTKAPHCLALPSIPLTPSPTQRSQVDVPSLPPFSLPPLWSQHFPGFPCFVYWVLSLAAFGLLCPHLTVQRAACRKSVVSGWCHGRAVRACS